MVELELVGLSEDGHRLVLADAEGDEFTVPVDTRLRAVVRDERARPGQLEIEMESALRPRDIQARIRAGETPDAVAQVAQVPVDRIMGYAVPVLAERGHIADRAQRCAVRRKNGDGPGRLLGDAVAERLRSRNVDPDTSEWDAWRREDGRWTVAVHYRSGERQRTGLFVYDALGRYTVAEDDDGRWLVGEPTTKRGPQPRERSGRRLSAVTVADDRDDDAFLFEDAAEAELAMTAVADAVRERELQQTPDEAGDGPAGAGVGPETDAGPEPERVEAEVETTPEPATEPKPERRGRRGRASVPSWDEIMFGQRKD